VSEHQLRSDPQLSNEELLSIDKKDSKPKRILISGVPYIHPVTTIQFDDWEHSLSWWDRMVLLSGGVVLGFSQGVCLTFGLFATRGDSLSLGLLVCAGVVFLSSVANVFWIVRTHKLIQQMSTKLEAVAQQQSAS
jgi:hypothetical protein